MRKPPIPTDLLSRIPKRAVALLGLLIAAVGGVYVLHNLYVQRTETQAAADKQANRALAISIASKLATALNDASAALARDAEDPKVVGALTSGDPAARQAIASTLTSTIPGALLLRLVPAGTVQPDTTQQPPLTYAGIDLLRQAAVQEKPIGAEIHLGGTPEEHIAVVRRVPPVGTPVGFLHLALNPSVIRDAMAAVDGKGLLVELRQPVPGAVPLVVARHGSSDNAQVDVAQAMVPGTAWQVFLRRVDRSMIIGGGGNLRALLLPAVLAALLLGLALVLVKRRRAAPLITARRPVIEANYQGAIRAILAGEYPGLEQLLPRSSSGEPLPKPVPMTSDPFAATTEMPATEPTVLRPVSDVPPEPAPAVATGEGAGIDPVIFRDYDIRGVVGKSLSNDAVYQIGLAIGSEAQALGQQTVIVARDGRVSSVSLQESLVKGLLESGRDVLEIGLTPTPVLYFATHYLDTRTGVMITGSHNPPEYNGLKIVLNGKTLCGDAIQAIRRRIEQQDFVRGQGALQQTEIVPDYIRRISEEIPVSLGDCLKVVVDCGNSVPGIVAPHILRAIGHDVIELYCEVDGEFPNHHPDPSQPENLEDLIIMVKHEDADLGLAFDGDGDRLGVVDRHGNIIWPDRQLMLFARDVLSRNPGAKIIYDVKCSRRLGEVIREAGGEPIVSRSGHSVIKSKMQETGALLGGDLSGHIFFKERWYGFDDALYAAARLLEILVNAKVPAEQVFAGLPSGVATPELRLEMPESRHAEFMQEVFAAADFPDAEISDLDGFRADLPDSWGLVRPSNTTPCLVLRFEGDNELALESIKDRFRALLLGIDPSLTIPF